MWVVGEEKEVAWPERSEGLVRPVLCVCHTLSREKQVLFLSVPFQSWAPSEAESHTLPLLQSQSSI